MHDDSHPYRTESRNYPQQVRIVNSYPWHGGTVFETKTEQIYVLPIWDDVVVADKQLLALSVLEQETSH